MRESLKRNYLKEEEFLDEFYDVANEAVGLLEDQWRPNPECDDNARKNRDYFLSTGELHSLTFDSAAVYHNEKGFSSAQISLRSSKRIVTVRVKNTNEGLDAEKVVDQESGRD